MKKLLAVAVVVGAYLVIHVGAAAVLTETAENAVNDRNDRIEQVLNGVE